jgi:hypothetical protein
MWVPTGAGVLRLQKLTLHMAQPSVDLSSASVPSRSLGQVVSLPRIPQARSRRPSAMAMQMGLVPGAGPTQYHISQVDTWIETATC